jgi:hypothetical protein
VAVLAGLCEAVAPLPNTDDIRSPSSCARPIYCISPLENKKILSRDGIPPEYLLFLIPERRAVVIFRAEASTFRGDVSVSG